MHDASTIIVMIGILFHHQWGAFQRVMRQNIFYLIAAAFIINCCDNCLEL